MMKKIFLLITMMITISSFIYAAAGPAFVDLGTAENYVILAKSAISATSGTYITGDVALSPAAESYITGFPLTRHSSGTYSTAPTITGQVFAADLTSPTPSILTTAVGDMEIAYTDAAGRVTPDHTELYAGDISNQTLQPGLYKWSSSVSIDNRGVTLMVLQKMYGSSKLREI